MRPAEAYERLIEEIRIRPRLKIAAISGPGEPLANPESFDVMRMIRQHEMSLKLCISTNGILVANRLEDLIHLDVETISVSISTTNPATAQRIYDWAFIDGRSMGGREMGEEIVKRQLQGIEHAVNSGIRVKVNTILIPTVNETEMVEISQTLSSLGVSIQNIVPLIPCADMVELQKPSRLMIMQTRNMASRHLRQFNHCYQCRSDVVGIPGHDQML